MSECSHKWAIYWVFGEGSFDDTELAVRAFVNRHRARGVAGLADGATQGAGDSLVHGWQHRVVVVTGLTSKRMVAALATV